MPLKRFEPGQYGLNGVETFDCVVETEQQGRKVLEKDLMDGVDKLAISLKGLQQGDSATLSICLSWLRLARRYNATLCLFHIPPELSALAQITGVSHLLLESACPEDHTL